MVAPISSLANMEYSLYGGSTLGSAAPSYLNGYMGQSSIFNNSFYNPYGYYNNSNPSFGQSIPANYSSANNQQKEQTIFQGLTQQEKQALVNDYAKGLTPSESLASCAITNALFGFAMNPRLIAHPYNTIKTLGSVNSAFKDVKVAGSALNKLWVNPENSNILREAYLQIHKAEARCLPKLGAFRRSYAATGDVEAVQKVVNNLKTALKNGNMEQITKYTAELQHAYSSNQGFLARGVNKVKGIFVDSKPMSVAEKLKDTAGIDKRVADLVKTKDTSYLAKLKHGGGLKGGLMFAGLELLMSYDKIKTAFSKDTSTGMTQLGQTTVKAAGNAAGWALGEAAGLWAFTKLGASIGTALGPGIGTLIGGAVGLVGGGIGMWLMGKLTKGLVGRDVADDVKAQKLAQTSEGQVELLQYAAQKMQKGEKIAFQSQQAVQKVLNQYA